MSGSINIPNYIWNLISKSPIIDRTFPNDDYTKGLRLSRDVIMNTLVPLEGTPVKNVARADKVGGVFTFITVNTPTPPPIEIIQFFQNIELVQRNEKGNHFPFFTWQNYATMWKYLNGIMDLKHDEIYWHWIKTGNEKMAENLEALAQMMRTFMQIAIGYGNVINNFGMKTGYGTIPQEWWNLQADMRIIQNPESFEDMIKSLFSTCSPAPHYQVPTRDVFDKVVNILDEMLALAVQGKSTLINPPIGGYITQTQPKEYSLMTVYCQIYKEFYEAYKKKNNTILTGFAVWYWNDWKRLVGDQALQSKNYDVLRAAWGETIQKKKMEVLPVKRVILQSKSELPALRYPPPKPPQAKFLQQLDEVFGTKPDMTIPIPWLLESLEVFNTSGFPFPLDNRFDPKFVMARLEDPDQWRACQFIFEQMIQGAYRVALLCRDLSDGWKKPYDAWVWNQQGLNKQQQDDIEHKTAPHDESWAQDRWPEPWKLSKEELSAYLDYQSGVEKGHFPPFRPIRTAEKEALYNEAKNKSIGYYTEWRNRIMANPAALEKYPIKGPIMVKIDGKQEQIINFYPDFGIWEYKDKSPWQKAVNDFLSPWKALTGKELFDDLLDRVVKICNALWPILQGALNDLTNDFNKIALPVIGMGLVAVWGLKEFSNLQANQNKKNT